MHKNRIHQYYRARAPADTPASTEPVSVVALIIAGQTALAGTLSMSAHEALAQRIVVNYTFNGLSKDEMTEYIGSRLKSCGVRENMFAENALEAMWGCCASSPRVVNSLAEKCLMLGMQKGVKLIDADIVMMASSELALV